MSIRYLRQDTWDMQGFTDENSLARLGLSQPDILTRKMTYLYGRDQTTKFSFLAMTEGNGNVRYQTGNAQEVNDVQYVWPVIGRMKFTTELVSSPTISGGNTTAGIGMSIIEMIFKDRLGIRDYGLLSPDQNSQLQFISEGEQVTTGYLYRLQLRSGDMTEYVALSNFMAGSNWLLIGSKVPESGSVGNEMRIMAGGKMTNQISFSRYTQKIEGNIANKVAVYMFDGNDTKNGGPTELWIAEQQRQFDVLIREMQNKDLYLDEYNRNTKGEILLKYWRNSKPIPIGAGIKETIKDFGQYIPYSGYIPLPLIDNTVSSMLTSDTDDGTTEYVIHGGTGFLKAFHLGIMADVSTMGYTYAMGLQAINGTGGKLSYGKYFNQYRTIQGHTITVIPDKFFDEGSLAMQDKANGRLYNGLPLSSYTGVAMDYSVNGGERNVDYIAMKGQRWITGIYEGMSPIPDIWRPGNNNMGSVKQLGTDADEATYEIKTSGGINIKKADRCFLFEFTP